MPQAWGLLVIFVLSSAVLTQVVRTLWTSQKPALARSLP
jgi:hypothetical protein